VRRECCVILMTSIAFILGVVPLLTATGAGSASQQSLGTVVFGGMIASTLLAIPFVPVFYLMMQRISGRLSKRAGLRKTELSEASSTQYDDPRRNLISATAA